MFSWRVTKYNPQNRDKSGRYQTDDWTSCGDIGKVHEGKIVTVEDYMRVENAYIAAILLILRVSGINNLRVKGLEKYSKKLHKDELSYSEDMKKLLKVIRKGQRLEGKDIENMCRLILREQIWCELSNAKMFVHFGWDYYMYLGCMLEDKEVIKSIGKQGLYMEPMRSPYAKY
ncbi:hypothetical protein D3C81_08760 [compost metagenome]